MDFSHALLLIALCLQWYNMGTIWFCQTTVYPLFGQVAETGYSSYHKFYVGSIPFSVIVPGFLSFLMPLVVLIWRPEGVPLVLALGNLIAGIVGLLITVGLEIPRHNRLENGKDDRLIAELIRYNWPRTTSITVSAALTTAMVIRAFTPA
jgi:hypothetical protein